MTELKTVQKVGNALIIGAIIGVGVTWYNNDQQYENTIAEIERRAEIKSRPKRDLMAELEYERQIKTLKFVEQTTLDQLKQLRSIGYLKHGVRDYIDAIFYHHTEEFEVQKETSPINFEFQFSIRRRVHILEHGIYDLIHSDQLELPDDWKSKLIKHHEWIESYRQYWWQ